jgi:hypothetical protein
MRLKNGTSPLSKFRRREDLLDPEKEVRAIKQCLEYLSGEAMKLDLRLAAHLISVAAESLEIRDPNGSA